MLLGAAVATYVQIDSKDPFNSFPHAFSSWFLVPFLVVAIVQLFAINSMDLYSSGVTLQALGVAGQTMERRPHRHRHRLRDHRLRGVLGRLQQPSQRLRRRCHRLDRPRGWRSSWSTGCCAASATCPLELQRTDSGGLYWRRGGVHWPALVAQALGTVASVLAFNQSFYAGPIARAFGGAGPTSACSRGSWWAACRTERWPAARRAPGGAPARSSAG